MYIHIHTSIWIRTHSFVDTHIHVHWCILHCAFMCRALCYSTQTYTHVCMHAYIHIYIHNIRVHAYTCSHMCMHTHVRIWIHPHAYIIHIHTCMHTYIIHIHKCMCIYIHVHICRYTHIATHKYTHSHTHTHGYTSAWCIHICHTHDAYMCSRVPIVVYFDLGLRHVTVFCVPYTCTHTCGLTYLIWSWSDHRVLCHRTCLESHCPRAICLCKLHMPKKKQKKRSVQEFDLKTCFFCVWLFLDAKRVRRAAVSFMHA